MNTVNGSIEGDQRAPLSGVRVLDLSRVLAGPLCTMQLGDLGADVVKVENALGGDETRHWGPPWWDLEQGRMSAYFASINRNKRSIAVNLKTDQGQDIIRKLAESSGVLVENFRPGQLARWGLDWEGLRHINPRLVYCSITGFGSDAPLSDRPGYDSVIQAMSGLMSITGAPDGPPQKVGVAISDVLTGLYSSIAILGALRKAEATEKGQHLELSLFECQIASLVNVAGNYLCSRDSPGRFGNAHANIVPYQVFPASNGHFMLAVGNDGQFQKLCAVIGRDELASDGRYHTNPARVENRESLVDELKICFEQRTLEQWVDDLNAAGVPAGPIQDVAAALSSPQAVESKLVNAIGGIQAVGSPFRSAEATVQSPSPPPLHGEHTEQILVELLGYGVQQVASLKSAGVIA